MRALRTPLTLAVLTLLAERPRHPYEMKVALRERHVEDVVKLRGGSLYDAIGRLERAELVRQVGTARAGARPERTVYEITETGRVLLRELLEEMLTEPVNEYPRFVAALAHLPALDRESAARMLRLRAERLREDHADTARMVAQHADGIPRAVLLEAEFLQHQRAAEIDWLDGVARDIDHGMAWPNNEFPAASNQE
ncbi:PadR family transcriptional regulator [Nocardia cyriacigeorgica]|uniref:Transcriptional regulator, PadR family n=3 Tax=Nocardia TaxID=1817 RepID=H6RCG4_NOCCG|nr:helix-turn-helix transcriptional regulator [Nocardia cyriacigeorgica]MBF6287549.1 helix-turn-helix transcriptional regulator [Nocardia cyriacigeorgica]MBF6423158.1 helix-turn-helix transcriptional regulator [Nocardia cyriacigeorgica]NEW32867.1 PadR family transcriptional regulator [Nocardia cyriacigeorgica]CCF63904.1 Transcriptional regulator, PadR family [Nocardia cyriacigeorgica GUH-2]BDT87557.1 PadR family transcriptional regulator [Nocardia cyriacigeorgica]